jgi:phospholipid-binding lipoprotein MlaA
VQFFEFIVTSLFLCYNLLNCFLKVISTLSTKNILPILLFVMFSVTGPSLIWGEDQKQQDDAVFSDFDEFGTQEEAVSKPVFDPLRGYNRVMFKFNDKMYYWVLKPVSKGYGKVVPEPVRLSFKRFFHNIRFPIRFVNNILQIKMKGSGRELARFVTNSTLGLLGFFDPARAWWGIEPSEEDFGQTLGHYGVGGGFPIVLPFLGPSNLRDALSLYPDYYLDPIAYTPHDEKVFFNTTYIAVGAAQIINDTSLRLGTYENIKKNALDPYTFVRDAYKQNRDKKIKE